MNKHLIVLGISVLLICVGLSGCNEQNNTYNDNSNYAPKIYSVRYEVTGSAESVSVTYANRDGGTSQESDVNVPWSYPRVPKYYVNGGYPMHRGDWLYISAQNSGKYGSVSVAIYVDDIKVKHSSSYGAYVIATASGFL